VVAGFATIGAGTALLAVLSDGLAVAALLGAFTLMGVGLGTASVASTQAGTEAADEAGRGAAAGMLNSAAQIGTAAGLALLTPLATSTGSGVLAGYRVGFIGTCVLAAAGLTSSFLLPSRNRPARSPAPAHTSSTPHGKCVRRDVETPASAPTVS
jgi:MFS family permease